MLELGQPLADVAESALPSLALSSMTEPPLKSMP